jgi:uncharacterized protein
MTQSTVAIIGTGAAGLACGHLLHKNYDLTVYEQADYLGGHANSITVEHNGETVRFDTAFVVFNDPAYPNFIRALDELKVPHMRAPMSFSFRIQPSGLEYMTRGLTYCFCDWENLRSLSFWKLLYEMGKFYRQAPAVLTDPKYRDYSIDAYVREHGYSEAFTHSFLIPLIAVTWSLPPEKMLEYPIFTLVEFLYNHGALRGFRTGQSWRTVTNGSRSYIEKLVVPFQDRIQLGCGATAVKRYKDYVEVTDTYGQKRKFTHVILTCHADQSLRLLADPTPAEQAILSKFKYNRTQVVAHYDPSVMPRKKRNWAAWNYFVEYDADNKPLFSFTYHMNRLQQVSKNNDYFVTIDGTERIDKSKIFREFTYEHPLFDLAAIKAQAELPRLNTDGQVYFCGSYCKYGFHEDAFRSGVEVCRRLTGQPIWE